jgi:hypothetical protein
MPRSFILVSIFCSANFWSGRRLAGEDGGAGHRLVSRLDLSRPSQFPDLISSTHCYDFLLLFVLLSWLRSMMRVHAITAWSSRSFNELNPTRVDFPYFLFLILISILLFLFHFISKIHISLIISPKNVRPIALFLF